jgi:uncharacterized protein YggE
MNQFLDETQRRYIFNSMLAVFIVLAVFLGVKAIDALKEYSYIGRGTYAANVISVTGKGEVTAIPDTGSFSFSVVENAKTVKDAQDSASKKTNDIIAAVKAMGVEEKDIQTTGYNVYPKYDYTRTVCPQIQPMSVGGSTGSVGIAYPCDGGKQVLSGYEVSQTITVKVRKTADAGAILTKVGSLGATNISGLDFVIDNQDAVLAQARDKAISDAKDKAKLLAKSLGIRLTKIVNFYESGNQPIYYGMSAQSAKVAAGDVVSIPPQIPVGENKITSNVTITYEVE